MSSRYYVTTPIYYVNDVPHLGTAYSTIAADVMARYHRVRGQQVHFLTGTDEHGLKLERVAQENGLSAKQFTDRASQPFRDAWPKLACSFTDFIRTTDPTHETRVGELWSKVQASGDLYLGSYEGFYCVGCEAYYTEKELIEGNVCPLHRRAVERIREPTYFFRLSAYADRLLDLYERNPHFVSPVTRMNEVKSFVRGGLEDLSVSRTTFNWGVPVPGDPAHVMYVWFDALFSYLTPLLGSSELRAFWPADLHLVGKDILRFHAVYWPAFLLSAGFSEEQLPRQIFAHGFLTFNGQKMSKSLRNTANPLALAEAFGVDPLRYYLMRAIAFGQDGDFNLHDLVTRYNTELGNALGNLLNRVLSQCIRMFDGKYPASGARGELESSLFSELDTAQRGARAAYDAVQPHRALEAIWGVVSSANQYVDRAAPWVAAKKGDNERAGTIFAAVFEVLESVSRMLWPVMPSTSDALRQQLGLNIVEPSVEVDLWPEAPTPRSPGARLGVPSALFPRIEADRAAELIAQLGVQPAATEPVVAQGSAPATPSANAEVEPAPESASPSISYADFAKLDLRVGIVTSAEKVPKKDKLLSLRVDLGEGEPRPIIAGLALSFSPESLVGRRVVVVANLEPRSFGKSLLSHGMILATGPSEALHLLTVDDGAPAGSSVK